MRLAVDGAEGLELASSLPFDAAIVDVMMPGMDGIAVARGAEEARRRSAGADDHRVRVGGERHRGDEARRVRLHHQAVQERRSAGRRPQRGRAAAAGRREHARCGRICRRSTHKFAGIIGRSPRMKQVFDLIIQAAPSRSTILIHRRKRHGQGARRARDPHATRRAPIGRSSPSTPATCRPICSNRRSSATSRARSPARCIRRRASATWPTRARIFFDEIGNIPLETQAKLLRVMQEREFMRLGGMETIKVDVRIIAATNCDLQADDGGRAVPRGPLLPAARDQHLSAAAARAEGRHPAARAALPREVRRGERARPISSSRPTRSTC